MELSLMGLGKPLGFTEKQARAAGRGGQRANRRRALAREAGFVLPYTLPHLVNRLDTALHITVLHHGFYVGAISIWGGAGTTKRSGVKARPELNSLDLNVSTSSGVEAGETADHA
jgi:hypothetical protein